MWDFLLHPSEPDLVLGRQLEVETSCPVGRAVPGPVLGRVVAFQTEAIKGPGRGFNVTKARLHWSPLPAASSLQTRVPAPGDSTRGSSTTRVLAPLPRGRPLVVLKSEEGMHLNISRVIRPHLSSMIFWKL